jgi:hypothetical protein
MESSSKQAIKNGKKPGHRGKQGGWKLECFICGDEHFAMSCPYCKKVVKEVMKESKDDDDEKQVNIAFEANAFQTYQANAIKTSHSNGVGSYM